MSTWTSRYSEKWPRLTALFNLDGGTREGEKPNMRFEQPYPQDPDAYYKFYLHPDDIGQSRSLSQYSVGGSDGKKGDGESRASPIRVCLGAMLLFSLAGVVCVAVTLAVLLSQPHRLVYSTVTPGNSSQYTASFIAKKEKQLQKEICGIMGNLFTFKHSENQTSETSCNISLKVEEGHLKIIFKVPTPDKFVEEDMEKMKVRLLINAKNAGLFNDLDDLLVDAMGQTVVIKDDAKSPVNETLPFAGDIIKVNHTETPDHTELFTTQRTIINSTRDIITFSDEAKLKTYTTEPPVETRNVDVLSKISESTTQTIDHLENPFDMSSSDGIFSDQFLNDLLNIPLDLLHKENKTEKEHIHRESHQKTANVEEEMKRNDKKLLGDLGLSMEHLPEFFENHMQLHNENNTGNGHVHPESHGHENDTHFEMKLKTSEQELLGELGLSMEHLPGFFESHMSNIHLEQTTEGMQKINDTDVNMLDNILESDLKNIHMSHGLSDNITTEKPEYLQNVRTEKIESNHNITIESPAEVKSKVEIKRKENSKLDQEGFWLTSDDLLSLSEFNDPHAKLHLDDTHFHNHSSPSLSSSLESDSLHDNNDSQLLSDMEQAPSILPSDVRSVVSSLTVGTNITETMDLSSLSRKDNGPSLTGISTPFLVISSSSIADEIQTFSLIPNEYVQSNEQQTSAFHAVSLESSYISSSMLVSSQTTLLDLSPSSSVSQEAYHLQPSSESFEASRSYDFRTLSFEQSTMLPSLTKYIHDTDVITASKSSYSDASLHPGSSLELSTRSLSSLRPNLSSSSELFAQNNFQLEQLLDSSIKREDETSIVPKTATPRLSYDVSNTYSAIQTRVSKIALPNISSDASSFATLESSGFQQDVLASIKSFESDAVISKSLDELQSFWYSSSIPASITADDSNMTQKHMSSILKSSLSNSAGVSDSEIVQSSITNESQFLYQNSSNILSSILGSNNKYDSAVSPSMGHYVSHLNHAAIKSSAVLSSDIILDSSNSVTNAESIKRGFTFIPSDKGATYNQIQPSLSSIMHHDDSVKNASHLISNSHILASVESISKSAASIPEYIRINNNTVQPSKSSILHHDQSHRIVPHWSLYSHILASTTKNIADIQADKGTPYPQIQPSMSSIMLHEYSTKNSPQWISNSHILENVESMTKSFAYITADKATTQYSIQPSKSSIIQHNGPTKKYLQLSSNSHISSNVDSITSRVTYTPENKEISNNQIQPSKSSFPLHDDLATHAPRRSSHSNILQSLDISGSLHKQHSSDAVDKSLTMNSVTAEFASSKFMSTSPNIYTSSKLFQSTHLDSSDTTILPSLAFHDDPYVSTTLSTETVRSLSSLIDGESSTQDGVTIRNEMYSMDLTNRGAQMSMDNLIQLTHLDSSTFDFIPSQSNSNSPTAVFSSTLPLYQADLKVTLKKKKVSDTTRTDDILDTLEYYTQEKVSPMSMSQVTDFTEDIAPTFTKIYLQNIDKNLSHLSTLESSVITYDHIFTSRPLDESSQMSTVSESMFTHAVSDFLSSYISTNVLELQETRGRLLPSESSSVYEPYTSDTNDFIYETSVRASTASLRNNLMHENFSNEPTSSDLQHNKSIISVSKTYSTGSILSSSITYSVMADQSENYTFDRSIGHDSLTTISETFRMTNNNYSIRPAASLNPSQFSESGSLKSSSLNSIPRYEYIDSDLMNKNSKVADMAITDNALSTVQITSELSATSLISPSMSTELKVDETSLQRTLSLHSASIYSLALSQEEPINMVRQESTTSIRPTLTDSIISIGSSNFLYGSGSNNDSIVSNLRSATDSTLPDFLPSSQTMYHASVHEFSESFTQTQPLLQSYTSDHITTVPARTTADVDINILGATTTFDSFGLQTPAYLQLNDTVEAAPFLHIANRNIPTEVKNNTETYALDSLSKTSSESDQTTKVPITINLTDTVSNNENTPLESSLNVTTLLPLVSSSNVGFDTNVLTRSPIIKAITKPLQATAREKEVATDHSTNLALNIKDANLSTVMDARTTLIPKPFQGTESVSERTAGLSLNLKKSTIAPSSTTPIPTRFSITPAVKTRITPVPSRTLLSQRQLQRLRARLAQLQALRRSRARAPSQSGSNPTNEIRSRQNRRRNFSNAPLTPIPNTLPQARRRQPGSFINRNSVPANRQNIVGASRNVQRSNIRDTQTSSPFTNLRTPGRTRALNPAQNGLLLFNLPGLDTNRFLGGANINWNRRFPG